MSNYLPTVNARNVKNLRIIRVLLGNPKGGLLAGAFRKMRHALRHG